MTENKIFPSIHIHPILLIFIFISFITGTFLNLLVILIIVLIHELGHYSVATFFRWRIKRIMLWVFGGVMETDEHVSKPISEELLVTLAGPLQHVFIYILLYVNSLEKVNLLASPIADMVFNYNTLILVFNLLPIWPLDGGKVLYLILAKYIPFRKAYNLTLGSSMVGCLLFMILQLAFFSFNLSALLILVFLFIENKNEWQRRYYVFIRFLLNRYQGHSDYNKVRNISVLDYTPLMEVFSQFYREDKHFIYVSYPNRLRERFDENDCLRSYFYDKEVNIKLKNLQNSSLTKDFKKW